MEIKYGRNRKGIRRELRKKLKSWFKTIDDPLLRATIEKNTIVTGGSICSMLLGEPVNDFDIYFRDKQTAFDTAVYYVDVFNENNKIKNGNVVGANTAVPIVRTEILPNIKGEEEDRVVIYIKSAGVVGEDQETYEYFEAPSNKESQDDFIESLNSMSVDPTEEATEELLEDIKTDRRRYRPVFMSQNAITLSNKVQLVTRFYGEPDEIHNNYDFVHAKCYYDYSKDLLHFDPAAMEAMMSRTLRYEGSLYPIASIFRMKKFLDRGWRINAGQQLKIMWQISELDLTDSHILREQLTGVDMAYMYELIQALKGVDSSKINSTYIGEIIDKVFQ
ncbi:MAG: hypothetical protein QM489_01175 [Candidatus Izemoplasma sp.]